MEREEKEETRRREEREEIRQKEERENRRLEREQKRAELELERELLREKEKIEAAKQQHELEIENARRQHELEIENARRQEEEKIEAARRQHELEMKRLEIEQGQQATMGQSLVKEERVKAPKLPSFVDGKDDLDAYLQHFERFAKTANWDKTGWTAKLSALLSGRALDVYSRLSDEAANDYDQMKIALMKRYDLTEDGYRRKFRGTTPEVDESPDQFIVRLIRYLARWIELSKTDETFEGLRDLVVKEQFIDSCPKELAIHLRERAPESLDKIAKIADQYLEAHGKRLFSSGRKQPDKTSVEKVALTEGPQIQCYKCNAREHKIINCPSTSVKRFICGKQGHEARSCRSNSQKPTAQSKAGKSSLSNQVSAGCLVPSPPHQATAEEIQSCIKDDKLLLACGKKIPLVSNACIQPLTGA